MTTAQPLATAGAVAEIVVGFVMREGRLLARPRPGDPALDGRWELPGGKVAPGEDHRAALEREVREETGLEVEVGELVCALCHAYADRRVALHAYACDLVRHDPAGTAGSPFEESGAWTWLSPAAYLALGVPAANPPLVDALVRTLAGSACGR